MVCNLGYDVGGLDVQTKIKRAEFWSVTLALAELFGPSTVHTDDNMVLLMVVEQRRRMHWTKADKWRFMVENLGVADDVCRKRTGLWM